MSSAWRSRAILKRMQGYDIHARLAVTALFLFAPAAQGWDATGHAIVCAIAYQELTSGTRKQVDRLIALDPRYDDYPASCYYPDTVDDGRRPEHYVNFPRDTQSITKLDCPQADRCIFTAIAHETTRLTADSNDLTRLEAIKYLGHWIGDLHQPMHVSFQDDRGGNDILTTGKCRGSLHSTWDGCIIRHRLLTHATPRNINRYARRARDLLTEAMRDSWTQTPLHAWANESFQVTVAPQTRYCDQQGALCMYDASARQVTRPEHARRSMAVDNAYLSIQGPIVRDRLLRAGIRLAHLLNTRW